MSAERSGAELVISVHNRGRAIAPDQIDRLFDEMKAIGAPHGAERRHLGLGLYIVDKIVPAYGGSVDVTSSTEEGTTFTVRLPPVAATSSRRQ